MEKNRSDRYAILSQNTLDILTEYWRAFGRPTDRLFPKQHDKSRPIDSFYLMRHMRAMKSVSAGSTASPAIPSAMPSAPTFMKTATICL